MKSLRNRSIIEEFNFEAVVDDYYQDKLKYKGMNNGILKLDWLNVKSSLVYGFLWAILVMMVRVVEAGSFFLVNWKDLVDAGGMAFFAVIIVLIKNLLTTDTGKFVGVVQVSAPSIGSSKK